MNYLCPICQSPLIWIESGAICVEAHGKIITFPDNKRAREEIEAYWDHKTRVSDWTRLPEAVRIKRGEYEILGERGYRRAKNIGELPYWRHVRARLPDTEASQLRECWFVKS